VDNIWFLVLVLAGLFFGYLNRFGGHREPVRSYYRNRIQYNTPISRKEFLFTDEVLFRKFSYYRHLSDDGKAKFINRTVHHLRYHAFKGQDGFEVKPEMKVHIAASISQITYGLDKYILDGIHTIMVYPRSFYVSAIDRTLKGGTTPNGFMALSWEDFEKGYEVGDDKYNLGLHEAAHALKLQVDIGKEGDERFAFYLKEWLLIGETEYNRIRRGVPSFLRDYAGENLHEFFAVCVEHFFESPEAFHQQLPDIFNHLCVLLNQNPLNLKGDYLLTEEYMRQVNQNPSLKRMPRLQRRA